MRDVVVIFLLFLGSAFGLLSAVGVMRMPDVFTRMHAMAKSTPFGLGALLLAAAIVWEDIFVASKCLAGLALLFATLPVAAQIIGRAAVHSGVELSERTVVNDLDDWPEASLPVPGEGEGNGSGGATD